jgi:SAM-dependent methyltransferase
MLDKDRRETLERYRNRWNQFGYDPRTLGWDKGLQAVRFRGALEGIPLHTVSSLADVGCGFGDLLTWLRERGWVGRYIGVDLVPELLAEARRRHSEDRAATFVEADISADELPFEAVDVAVSIGVFNHRLETDHRSFVRSTFEAMWRLSRSVVVCDFLSAVSDRDKQRPDLYYADAGEILGFAQQYSRRVMIHHAYMPFEFNVKVWHDDSFTVAAPAFTESSVNALETGNATPGPT